jgi:hypothetical protein
MTNLNPIAVDEQGAAALTSISVSSLQKMRVRGDGPPFAKLGNRVRYRVADLEAYVANSVVTSTSAQAA